MKSRKELLNNLLANKEPKNIPAILNDLGTYDWDVEEKFANITREHIISILQRYLAKELTAQDVEEWANAFEMREDVIFGAQDRDPEVFDSIYILASPLLEGELTKEKAQKLIAALKE